MKQPTGTQNHQTSELRFRRIYRAHSAFVRGRLRRAPIPRDLVEDIAQEVWITVYRRLGDLHDPHDPEGGPGIRGWLAQILRNHLMHCARGFARRSRKERGFAAERPDATDPFTRHDAALTVARLLAELSDKERQAVIASDLLGQSAPEIALAENLPVNTVYSRVRLARAHLRRLASAAKLTLWLLLWDLGRNLSRIGRGPGRNPPPGAPPEGAPPLASAPALAESTQGASASKNLYIMKYAGITLVGTAALATLSLSGTLPRATEPAPRPDRWPIDQRIAGQSGGPGSPAQMSQMLHLVDQVVRGYAVSTRHATPRITEDTTAPPERLAAEDDAGARPRAAKSAKKPRRARPRDPTPEDPAPAEPALRRPPADAPQLLRDARRALRRGDPKRALALAAAHRRQFPTSPLAGSRAWLSIDALCAAGEREAARELLQRELQGHTNTKVHLRTRGRRRCLR